MALHYDDAPSVLRPVAVVAAGTAVVASVREAAPPSEAARFQNEINERPHLSKAA